MSPPRKMQKTNEENKRSPPDGVIRFTVDKVTTLGVREGRLSPVIEINGIPWRARFCKYDISSVSAQVSLHCMANQLTPWSIDLEAEYKLVNENIEKNAIRKKSNKLNDETDAEVISLIAWKDCIDIEKGFNIDDTFTIEIRLWVSNMKGIKCCPTVDFADSNNPCHDVALMIEGKKIYVSKHYLALHSPVFKAMFFGEFAEKNQEEIELKDIDREEFIEFLHVLYPSNKMIMIESAPFLLKLGDRFQIQCVIDRAESCIIDSGLSNIEKLRIADTYKLFGLQDSCISELTTEEVKEIKKSNIYDGLPNAIKEALFDRVLQINH